MFCNRCGAQLPDGSKFCQSCGATQAPVETPKTEFATPTPPVEFAQPPQPPVAPQPNFVPPVQPPVAPITPPPAPKKNKTGIIIAAIVAIIVVVGVIVGVVLAGNGSSKDDEDDKKDETTSSQVSSTSADDDNDYDYDDYTKDNEDEETTKPVISPPSDVYRGTINGDVYKNDFAGLTFTKHSSWKYMSDKEIVESYYTGAEILAGDSFDAEAVLEQTGSFYDMMVAAPTGSPNLNIVINDLGFMSLEGLSAEEYLKLLPDELKKINPGYKCSEPRSATLSNDTYAFIDVSVNVDSVEVLQRMYVRIEGKYMIQITMTATAENSFETMENMFS